MQRGKPAGSLQLLEADQPRSRRARQLPGRPGQKSLDRLGAEGVRLKTKVEERLL